MEKNIFPQLKKRNKPNTNKENTNIIKYSITDLYDNLVINNNDLIEITIDKLKNDIYEDEFFNLKGITGDGNCFFRTLSYYYIKSKIRIKIYVTLLINICQIILLNFMNIVT